MPFGPSDFVIPFRSDTFRDACLGGLAQAKPRYPLPCIMRDDAYRAAIRKIPDRPKSRQKLRTLVPHVPKQGCYATKQKNQQWLEKYVVTHVAKGYTVRCRLRRDYFKHSQVSGLALVLACHPRWVPGALRCIFLLSAHKEPVLYLLFFLFRVASPLYICFCFC